MVSDTYTYVFLILSLNSVHISTLCGKQTGISDLVECVFNTRSLWKKCDLEISRYSLYER